MSDLPLKSHAGDRALAGKSQPLAAGPTRPRILRGELVLVAPLLVFICVAFNLPLLMTIAWSAVDPAKGGVTMQNYADFFGSSTYLAVIARTARVALTVSAVCALVGYPLSYWMISLSRRGQQLALAIIVTSFWVSILVRTYAWIVVLGNAGLINRLLLELGVIEKPIQFLYGELGVCIGMINVLLPFMLLPLYAAMMQVDPRLRQIAYTLGASSNQFFWRVFFPLTLPALSATFVLIFILSLGFYITPAILGGGKVPLVANMLDMLINQFPHWNLASAMAVVLLVLTLGLYGLYQKLRGSALGGGQ
jgi:ABC-type spermidine/putrescine transport system permease subunit I